MKKSILTTIVSLSIAIFAAIGINVNLSNNNSQNYLAFENIEALARGEASGSKTCYWNYFHVGGNVPLRTCSQSGYCIGYEGFQASPGSKTGTCIN